MALVLKYPSHNGRSSDFSVSLSTQKIPTNFPLARVEAIEIAHRNPTNPVTHYGRKNWVYYSVSDYVLNEKIESTREKADIFENIFYQYADELMDNNILRYNMEYARRYYDNPDKMPDGWRTTPYTIEFVMTDPALDRSHNVIIYLFPAYLDKQESVPIWRKSSVKIDEKFQYMRWYEGDAEEAEDE